MKIFKSICGIAAALLAPITAAHAIEPVYCEFFNKPAQSEKQISIYVLHQKSDRHKYFDKDCDGKLSPQELAAHKAWLDSEIDIQLHFHRRRQAAGIETPLPAQRPSPPPVVGGWNSQFILRDSFEDIAVYTRPKDVKFASGAQFNFARDEEVRNTIWSAKGVMAYPFWWQNPEASTPGRPYLAGFAVTPTVAFNRVSNSRNVRNDVNILSGGIGAEFAFVDMVDESIMHFARTRYAIVSNFDAETKSLVATAEYQPVTNFSSPWNLGSPNPVIGLPATYQLDAILRVQQSENADLIAPAPLFNFGNSVTRMGPVMMLSVLPFQGDNSPVPKWVQKANFNLSYSWLANTKNGQNYEHLMTSLGFVLDERGNVGFKISYEKGTIEETGSRMQLMKAGIVAKY